MKRNKRIALTILTIGLGGALFVALRGDAEPPPVAASPPSRPAAAHRPFSMAKLMAEGHAKAGDPVPADDQAASTPGIDDVMAETLDADPALRKFYELRRKALRTAAEQQDYLAMVSDAKLVADARKDLLAAVAATEVDQVEELRRLQRIQFLNSALAWDDNPVRAQALEAVTDVVMQQIPSGTPRAVTGSALGDKFDLFQLLMLSDPAHAQALLAQARGTPAEKILQLAWQTGSPDTKNQIP